MSIASLIYKNRHVGKNVYMYLKQPLKIDLSIKEKYNNAGFKKVTGMHVSLN